MNISFSSDSFNFLRIHFEKYHYTDNRKGSPMNYIAYMLKGKAIAIRMLPVYLIMAICTAVYYIADHFLQKRRESKLRNGSSL